MPNPEEQAAINGLQQRLIAALAGFQKLNVHRTAEQGYYSPPDGWALSTCISALVDVLADAGVVDRSDFAIRALRLQVEMVEGSLKEASEHMTKSTGVIVPLGVSTRPQG